MAELRIGEYYGLMRRLREIEPDNRQLQTLTGPNYVPSQRTIDELSQELTAAQQRAAARARPGAEAETDDPATPAQRANLRRNVIEAGLLRPGDPREGHHIVPGGGPMSGVRSAEPAQRQLARLGIGLDSVDNGAPLYPAFHRPVHTAEYYRYINNRLLQARTAEQARAILLEVRGELIRRDNLYQNTGETLSWP